MKSEEEIKEDRKAAREAKREAAAKAIEEEMKIHARKIREIAEEIKRNLLPCPFCGDLPLILYDKRDRFYLKCDCLGFQIPYNEESFYDGYHNGAIKTRLFCDHYNLIKTWNKRAQQDARADNSGGAGALRTTGQVTA